ncbi:hypothetical protein FIU94_16520 [Sulfitobacter sp. THAF37]|uniref:hypothetical protein n=1 Tax=Sulfitobacter sp. THAF37 TaxID=2587855 RepID=UPI001268B0BE|nr:hypothetical protein [Sulfitobacter sp. THAF37]QFT60436.1 hypothetical protein FIU94_16520 [Sulfitobacter sp. THAF37]
MKPLLVALLLGAGAATAEPLDTAQAFQDYVGGRTVYFDRGDGRGVSAAESYLEDRQVRWSERDGTCIEGEWFARDGLICFTYENNPDPQCWAVERTATGLVAVLRNGGFPTRIVERDPGGESFQCLGPKVGV